MIGRIWFTASVMTLLLLGVFIPSAAFAQHGPGRHGPDSDVAYDPKSETTFKGTVADVKTGRSALSWLFGIHTLGLGQKGVR